MKRQVAALIINRNRYLINKIKSGALAGAWDFPAVNILDGDDAFAALKLALEADFGLAVFPYKTDQTLVYNSPAETASVTLIKCSISNDTKVRLAPDIPSQYKWLYVYNTSKIRLTPAAIKICAYLTKGKTIAAYKPRGFAVMNSQTRKQIASMGGKAAHAMGKAHRWTSEEARRAFSLTTAGLRRAKNGSYTVSGSPRDNLLALLQASFATDPGTPVSFVALGQQLGISRQYVRLLYNELKQEYTLPPVAHNGAQNTRRR